LGPPAGGYPSGMRVAFRLLAAVCLVALVSRRAAAFASLDWRALAGDAPVIFVGELHGDRLLKEELIDGLDELKAAGVTHLALEIDDDLQPALDRLEPSVFSYMIDGRGVSELARAARAAGIQLVALDVPRAERAALLEAVCAAKPRCLRANQGADDPDQLAARDARMARSLAELARRPGVRVLAYVGAYHARSQPAILSRDYGVDARAYIGLRDRRGSLASQLQGADPDGGSRGTLEAMLAAAGRAREAGLAGSGGVLPADRERDGVDGYLVLPGSLDQGEGK